MPERSREKRRSIAQVNRMIRGLVEAETLGRFFWVRGKIEGYHKSNLGHVYFDLADGDTRIRCMLAARRSSHIAFDLHNDMDVEVYGDVQVYEKRAWAQIQALDVRLIKSAADASPADAVKKAEGATGYPSVSKRYLRLLDIIIFVLIALFIALALAIIVYGLTL